MEDDEEVKVPINNDLERRIAEAFDVFDHSGNKTVDLRDIGTLVRGLGCCPSEAEVQEIVMDLVDPSTPGSVHLEKFLPYMTEMVTEHRYQPPTPERLFEAFQVLDQDKKGSIPTETMKMMMTQYGEAFSQDELDEMLELANDPHTKTIPYEYFINQLMWQPNDDRDIYILADRIQEEKEPPALTTKRYTYSPLNPTPSSKLIARSLMKEKNSLNEIQN